MNAASGHPQTVNYVQTAVPSSAIATSESMIDKAYVTSMRGILKVACLVR